MPKLVLLFVVVPAVELALLIEVGSHIGIVPTFALIAATGVLGVYLARQQGLEVLRRMQEELAAGRVPVGPLLDGILILLAGAVLITPGVLTDILGFLCLVPGARRIIKAALRRRFERFVAHARIITVDGDARATPEETDDPPGQIHR